MHAPAAKDVLATEPPNIEAEAPNMEMEGENASMGSPATGYVSASELPPDQRNCGACVHFDGQGNCNQPEVIADPDVQGKVEADGCCDYVRPRTTDNNMEKESTEIGTGDVDAGEDSSAPFA